LFSSEKDRPFLISVRNAAMGREFARISENTVELSNRSKPRPFCSSVAEMAAIIAGSNRQCSNHLSTPDPYSKRWFPGTCQGKICGQSTSQTDVYKRISAIRFEKSSNER